MTPVNKLLDMFAAALGADTLTFSPPLSTLLYLSLIKVPYTPSPALVLSDTTDRADFTGSTALIIPAAVRVPATDPITGEVVLSLPPPAGGPKWTTSDAVNLPQTIYGMAMSQSSTSFAVAKLMAVTLPFETPITLTAAAQMVEGPLPEIRIVPGGFR